MAEDTITGGQYPCLCGPENDESTPLRNELRKLHGDRDAFKNEASLRAALKVDTLGDIDSTIKKIRDVTPTNYWFGHRLAEQMQWKTRTEQRGVFLKNNEKCNKEYMAKRFGDLGLPQLPSCVPMTTDEAMKFGKEHGTVILKPVNGGDAVGHREYQYRPLDAKQLEEELDLDLRFAEMQNKLIDCTREKQVPNTRKVMMQKFVPVDGSSSAYHYSYKGWVDNDGKFHLIYSYIEEWGKNPNYDSSMYKFESYQYTQNLNNESATYVTDSAIDNECARQMSLYCKGELDSCFMHGDAIITEDGKFNIIDLCPKNNFETLVSFCLKGKTDHITVPILFPAGKGDRQKMIAEVRKYGGHMVRNKRHDVNKMTHTFFLFYGKDMKVIQKNIADYTKAINSMA